LGITSRRNKREISRPGPLLGDMFSDKELNQIVHTVGYESTAGLLLLSRRIFALCSSGEYLERY
jgi:hypothetical protein